MKVPNERTNHCEVHGRYIVAVISVAGHDLFLDGFNPLLSFHPFDLVGISKWLDHYEQGIL